MRVCLEEVFPGIYIFGNGSLGNFYYPTNDMDPYLVEQDVSVCT